MGQWHLCLICLTALGIRYRAQLPDDMLVAQALVQDAVLRWRKGGDTLDNRPDDEGDGKVPLETKHGEGVHLMATHQRSTA